LDLSRNFSIAGAVWLKFFNLFIYDQYSQLESLDLRGSLNVGARLHIFEVPSSYFRLTSS